MRRDKPEVVSFHLYELASNFYNALKKEFSSDKTFDITVSGGMAIWIRTVADKLSENHDLNWKIELKDHMNDYVFGDVLSIQDVLTDPDKYSEETRFALSLFLQFATKYKIDL